VAAEIEREARATEFIGGHPRSFEVARLVTPETMDE
jgi:hypothetical protein